MADDNEDGWAFPDGSIQVLYGDGQIVTLNAGDLKEQFHWPRIQPDVPFPTYGPASPAPDLRLLDR